MAIAVPERVVIRDALPQLGILAALLFIVGCIYVIDGFVRALFSTITGTVGWIPYAGKVLAAPVHKIEQKVTHALGRAERAIDKRVGASFHKLALIARQIVREIAMTALMGVVIAGAIGRLVPWKDMIEYLRRRFDPLYKRDRAHDARLAKQGKQGAATRDLVTGKVIPRVKVSEARAATLERTRVRTRTRAKDRAQDAAIARLWRWGLRHRTAFTTKAFVGASAWALAKLGVSWIRCSNVKKAGRRLCRAPSDLIDLLFGVGVITFILSDVCAVMSAIREVAIRFEPYLTELLLEIEGHICGGREGAPSGIVASDWRRVDELASGL